MRVPIAVPKGEQGMIRVFAINRATADMRVAVSRTPKPDLARDLLDAPHLDTASAEIFPVSDLEGVGLTAYLTEGYAVPDAQLAPDKAKLDALDGYVLLLFSESFALRGATLETGPDVTLIGTYGEAAPDRRPRALKSKSAELYTGAKSASAQTPAARGYGSSLVVLAIVVLVLAVGWWALA
jgi:hypothetical protein